MRVRVLQRMDARAKGGARYERGARKKWVSCGWCACAGCEDEMSVMRVVCVCGV
jgi:hypothetical protein